MEVKIWMDGYQRIVCGVTDQTTCQDVIVTLAHASGTTGRYAMYERWKTTERRLPPTERPVGVLQRWGQYSNDVQLIIRHYGQTGDKKKKPAPGRARDLVERSVLSGGTALKKSLTFTGAHRRSHSMDQCRSDSRAGVRDDYSRNAGSLGRSSVVASRSSETPSTPRGRLERQDGGESGIHRDLCTRRLSATERKQTTAAAAAAVAAAADAEFPKVSENVATSKSPKGFQRRIFYVNSQSERVIGAGCCAGSVGAGGSGGGSSGGAGSAVCVGGGTGGSGGAGAGVVLKGQVSIYKTIADKEQFKQLLYFNETNMVPTNVANATRPSSAASILRTISTRSTSNVLPFSTPMKILSGDHLKKNPNNTNRNIMNLQTNSTILSSSSEKASNPPSKSVEFSNYCPIKDTKVAEPVNETNLRDFKIKEMKHRKLQRTAYELLYPTVTSDYKPMSVQNINFCKLRNCRAAGVSNASYRVPFVTSEASPVRSVESFAKPAHRGICDEETMPREGKQRMALRELIDEQDRELFECKSRLRQLNYEILLLEGNSETDEKLEELDPLSVEESKLDMKRQRESKPQTETERLAAELLQANIESQILERSLESVKQEIGIADRCLSMRREDLTDLERQLKGFNLNLFLKRHITATTYRRGLPSVAVSAKTLPRLQWNQQFPLLQ